MRTWRSTKAAGRILHFLNIRVFPHHAPLARRLLSRFHADPHRRRACSARAADLAVPTPPTVEARAYILADYRTGKVLAAQEATTREEPASLTKLMTAYIVFSALTAGQLTLNTPVAVSEQHGARGARAPSSIRATRSR